MAVRQEDIDVLEEARKILVRLGERGIAVEMEDFLEHLRLQAIGLK